jgi:dihydroorotate dehydrogenase (fumarate)
LRWISYLYGNTETDIAASGGVHNYSHLAKYLLAGADAVESCSVLYEKGLGAISEILKDLEKWMDKKGVASVKEMTGKAISESNINREEYLRAQFVKTVLAAGKTS